MKTNYFCVAVCPNEPPDAIPVQEICHIEHTTIERARECWYAKPEEYRQVILAYCLAHNCRVVIWENEIIDRVHPLTDA